MMNVHEPDAGCLQHDVGRALSEDLGSGDVTAALVPAAAEATAHVICRTVAIIAGRPWFDEVFRQLDEQCSVQWLVEDGQQVEPDTRICTVRGNARSILSGERTALNFLQTLSGTATTTSQYVKALSGTGCKVLDTRKTLPGLRAAQKYAVRCGGGRNHRSGLYDGILIKENHIMAAGSIGQAVRAAANQGHELAIEVEVESLDEAAQAIAAGADILLLDNFSRDALAAAVALARDSNASVKLEASGNITLDNIREVAETGVDFISVGALTKHLFATDLSMRFALQPQSSEQA